MVTKYRHTDDYSHGRHNLAGEHKLTDAGQLVLFGVFLVTWITDSFLFRYSVFLARYVPVYIRLPVGTVVLIVSALLALSALKAVFGEAVEKPTLLTDGVFAIVRHPMYLGSWLFSAGLVSITLSLSSALVSIGIIVFYYGVSKYEEDLLSNKFGAEYQKYKARVSMFFPLKSVRKLHPGRKDSIRGAS